MNYSANDIMYWLSSGQDRIWLGQIRNVDKNRRSIQITWADTLDTLWYGLRDWQTKTYLRYYAKHNYEDLYEVLNE